MKIKKLSSYFQIIFYEKCRHETYIKNNELQMSTAEEQTPFGDANAAKNKNKFPPHLTAVGVRPFVCIGELRHCCRALRWGYSHKSSSNSRCD
jgi:hypothetical protein